MSSSRINRKLRTIIVILLACLITASMMVRIIDYQSNRHVSTLSLRDSAPPESRALFLIESCLYTRYIRSGVGITYNGKTWTLQRTSEAYKYLDGPQEQIDIFHPVSTDLSQNYYDFNRDVLNEYATLDDPECLELPNNISDRVKELALAVVEGMPTPFEKAKAIETFLQVRFEYKLDYNAAPEGWEANDWFLFESKEGICGNFNSAFVILARAAGIPARLAAGYYVIPGDGSMQAVHASQAHAWAEVGFEEVGWLVFEATPQ